MVDAVDEAAIRAEVLARDYTVNVSKSWLTPSGRRRSAPMYEATIQNHFLRKSRTLRAQSVEEIRTKADQQLLAWADQELRQRLRGAREGAAAEAESEAEDKARAAREEIAAVRGILAATLDVNDRLDWSQLRDRERFPPLQWKEGRPVKPAPPSAPPEPRKSAFEWLIPSLKRKRLEEIRLNEEVWKQETADQETSWQDAVVYWEKRKAAAEERHRTQEDAFCQRQSERNAALEEFRSKFEGGDPASVVEYLGRVFEASEYPGRFPIERAVAFEGPSKSVVVDVTLPSPTEVSDVADYSYVKRTKEARPVLLKKKEHEELYDGAVKQSVIRTLHEVFESVYTEHVMNVVVNGWVTYVDKATGQDKTSCIVSVAASREVFEQLNLARIDPSECLRSLKGLVAGPLSQVAPVQPILQLNREDRRFVESEAVLAELNSTTNLATLDWEAFEHLVRELFEEMFSNEGAEVKVTQASRDGGVDAVAFDPDPIRGGKFVIQAKRYTKVVPVSAVRDLYGTLLNEGASRGILVTTAYYGRDARIFAQDKPLTLIDGPNLVYLLEQHGHKVRIDIAEARRQEP